MPQSYSKFTYEDLDALGIEVRIKKLFELPIQPCEPSDLLEKTLKMNLKRPLATEKAKSEFIIVPILNEILERNNNFFTFFSGYNFDVDKVRGLKGHCDFLLSTATDAPRIKDPVISVVEAKHENLDVGLPQCIAQIYAARLFNQQHKNLVTTIFGCVTFGYAWQFVKLEDNTAWIDSEIYYLTKLPELLGVWQGVIDFYK
jgi:hypothetical protein